MHSTKNTLDAAKRGKSIVLLGILAGEQIPPLVKQTLGVQKTASWMDDQVRPHMFGQLPKCKDALGETHHG